MERQKGGWRLIREEDREPSQSREGYWSGGRRGRNQGNGPDNRVAMEREERMQKKRRTEEMKKE